MSELLLTPKERQELKGRAHRLNPTVLLGAAGLSDAVLKEIDRALAAHELIKVRVPGDDRAEREQIFAAAADRLGAARVQMIGKLIVLFRPRPPEADATRAAEQRPTRDAKQSVAPRRKAGPADRGKASKPLGRGPMRRSAARGRRR
jgi:putative YhbY family RNA-binding protein